MPRFKAEFLLLLFYSEFLCFFFFSSTPYKAPGELSFELGGYIKAPPRPFSALRSSSVSRQSTSSSPQNPYLPQATPVEMSFNHRAAWNSYFASVAVQPPTTTPKKEEKKAEQQIFWITTKYGGMYPCRDPGTGYTTWLLADRKNEERMAKWLAEDPARYWPAADGYIYPTF
ncbi:hypothetical protein FN846DRAFT_682827 [Sphaerosporella brunnea]|uniref:Berberine/berberine-like domain-containing protein n=1 Tax=Sphaerosporella brunnea TaxID=1250544 RepID=A0A5J5EYL4_9PEZI|nr:hypothetical protein FN846DRAFT_682827 [Sphaerosporella brunnea]